MPPDHMSGNGIDGFPGDYPSSTGGTANTAKNTKIVIV